MRPFTRMGPKALIGGYWDILDTIYSPEYYYQRVIRLLREYRPLRLGKFRMQRGYVRACFKSVLLLGVLGKERFHFWRLLIWCLTRRPRLFPQAITNAVYGFHFRKVAEKIRGNGKFADNDAWQEKDGSAWKTS